MMYNFIHHPHRCLLIGYVPDDHPYIRTDFCASFFSGLFVDIGNRDFGTAEMQHLSDSTSNASTATSDNGYPAQK